MEEEYERVFNGEYECYNDHPKGTNDQLLAGLCYILGWVVSLVVLLAVKPLSPFLRFHAIQALGLQIVAMVASFVVTALMFVLIGLLLLPLLIGLSFYILIVGIIVITGGDHRVYYLADYVEENYV